MIVPALPEEPLVVLIGPGLVVLELLAENPAAFHVIHGLLMRSCNLDARSSSTKCYRAEWKVGRRRRASFCDERFIEIEEDRTDHLARTLRRSRTSRWSPEGRSERLRGIIASDERRGPAGTLPGRSVLMMEPLQGHEIAGARLVGRMPSEPLVDLWRRVTSGIVKYS